MIDYVSGATGVRIAVRGNDNPGAPVLVFVHGWAQSSAAWRFQFADDELSGRFRLLAMDLRGHGVSEVPDTGYDDARAWAGDLAAVLELAGGCATVVAWSYGGLVLADYLRVHGTEGVERIVLVGAITEIGKGNPGGATGPAMRAALPDALSDDPAKAVPALTAFSTGMTGMPLPGGFTQELLGTSLRTPPHVRAALFRRTVTSGDVLAAVDVPTLVVHGTEDRVVAPAAGEYAAGKIPGAQTRWCEGAGHLPFAEQAAEFNSAVGRFALDT